MTESLLKKEVQDFIRSYDGKLSELAFRGSPYPDITTQQLLEQIDGFRRSEKKLPSWAHKTGILYPPKVNLEQTSSEITATYKAHLVNGKNLADLTGGFGVDSYAFASKFDQVFYFDKNPSLASLAAHNFDVLGASNIQCLVGDSLTEVEGSSFHTIYLDPARRDASNGKVFRFADCDPDVVSNMDYLLERCDTLLIKSSPMLDLTEGLRELPNVSQIHIVSIQNEVKEVLWLVNESAEPVMVYTVNLGISEPQYYSFPWGENSPIHFDDPKQFLYEPNAALMKAGAFQNLSKYFNISKLSINAHLFTSDKLLKFPGRVFKIMEVRTYGKTALKDFKKKKAHITTRDFPESVQELRRKWAIKDGGETYLFFTRLNDGKKVVLVTQKL